MAKDVFRTVNMIQSERKKTRYSNKDVRTLNFETPKNARG